MSYSKGLSWVLSALCLLGPASALAQADAGAPNTDGFALKRRLERAYRAARAVDAGLVAREHPDDIPGAIQRARLAAIAAVE